MGNYYLYISENVPPGWQGTAPGISVYEMNRDCGALRYLGKYPCGANSNVSCADSDRGLLYVTTEEASEAARRANGARILTLRIDPHTHLPVFVSAAPTLSPNPAYITLDSKREYAVVVNHTTHNFIYKLHRQPDGTLANELVYDDATVCLHTINDDGSLSGPVDAVIHTGSGPLKTQTHAHPHSAVLSPSGALTAVCDKGADSVTMYRIDRLQQRLVLAAEPYRSRPGTEPRFCAFHPSKPWFYINHEGDLDIEAFVYGEDGSLTHLETLSAIPAGREPTPGAVCEHQGLSIHPLGHTLYSVTRGVDGIAVFHIDSSSGRLSLIQHVPISGQWPRCCQITHDGRWLLAGCREGDNQLIVFRIHPDGSLTQEQLVHHPSGVSYITVL